MNITINSNISKFKNISLVTNISLFLLLSTQLCPRSVEAAAITPTASGTVVLQPDPAKPAVPQAGVRVTVQLKDKDGKFQQTQLPNATGANGRYTGTGGDVHVGAQDPIPFRVKGKKTELKKIGDTVEIKFWKGINEGNVAAPAGGAGGAVNINSDITLTEHGTFKRTLSKKHPINRKNSLIRYSKNCLWIDPYYIYDLDTGEIRFINPFFLDENEILVDGLAEYDNGIQTTGNDVDIDGNLVNESIFGQNFILDPISLIEVDPEGNFIFSDGYFRIEDSLGTLYMEADIVDIVASSDPSTPNFFGFLSNITFGDNSLGSTLIENWKQDIENGETLAFFFDESFITQTNGFTESATLSTMVEVSSGTPVPEPSSMIGIFTIGVLGLRLKRKNFITKEKKANIG